MLQISSLIQALLGELMGHENVVLLVVFTLII